MKEGKGETDLKKINKYTTKTKKSLCQHVPANIFQGSDIEHAP